MRRHDQGMALIYVIVLMSLLSMYLVELMNNTRIMLRQTRRAEAMADTDLSSAFGIAWARLHSADLPPEGSLLDANDLSRHETSIRVLPDDQALLVETTCTLATESYKQTRKIKFLP